VSGLWPACIRWERRRCCILRARRFGAATLTSRVSCSPSLRGLVFPPGSFPKPFFPGSDHDVPAGPRLQAPDLRIIDAGRLQFDFRRHLHKGAARL